MTTETKTQPRGPSRDARFRYWQRRFNADSALRTGEPTSYITLIAPSLTGLFMWACMIALWSTVLLMALVAATRMA